MESDGDLQLAVTATIPWDSYLIRHGIWSYPPDATFNRTLYDIPLEEVAFFVLQTSITSLVYCICSKALVLPMYLPVQPVRRARDLGGLGLVVLSAIGMGCFLSGGGGTYLGLILIWSLPVVILQWLATSSFLTGTQIMMRINNGQDAGLPVHRQSAVESDCSSDRPSDCVLVGRRSQRHGRWRVVD